MSDSLDVNPLVNLAVALRNEMPRGIYKLIRVPEQKEVVLENLLALAELLLRLFKVKVNVEGLDEVGDGVAVLVALLAHNANQVFKLLLVRVGVAAAVAGGDDGGGEVAQDPGARGLDGVDVGGAEEGVGDFLARGLVVEEGEERPVDQPCAVLELCEGRVDEAAVDVLLDLADFLDGRVPVYGEDLAGHFAPCRFALLVVVCGLTEYQHSPV
jgi:hypothetical protein